MISAYRSLWKGQHCLNTRIEYTLAMHLCMKYVEHQDLKEMYEPQHSRQEIQLGLHST